MKLMNGLHLLKNKQAQGIIICFFHPFIKFQGLLDICSDDNSGSYCDWDYHMAKMV